jgi:hypothetical protein
MTIRNLREYSLTLVFNSWSDYMQNSPDVIFLIAASYRSETVVVRPCEGLHSDFINFSTFIHSYILFMSVYTFLMVRTTLWKMV